MLTAYRDSSVIALNNLHSLVNALLEVMEDYPLTSIGTCVSLLSSTKAAWCADAKSSYFLLFWPNWYTFVSSILSHTFSAQYLLHTRMLVYLWSSSQSWLQLGILVSYSSVWPRTAKKSGLASKMGSVLHFPSILSSFSSVLDYAVLKTINPLISWAQVR